MQLPCPDGVERPWYDVAPVGCFDFILVDGPPLRTGRGAALFALESLLAADGEVWLHDARRAHERECLELWRACLPFRCEVRDLDDRGVAFLRRGDQPATAAPIDVPAGLAATLLTGGRLPLLRRTVESLARNVPRLLERARVTVLVNGDDPECDEFVRRLPFVDHITRHLGSRLPVGPAASRLVAQGLKLAGAGTCCISRTTGR